MRLSLARRAAAVAFGPAAPLYAWLTSHEAWRADCRALAALVPGPRVLDLGVGPGATALEAARAATGARHVGLDLSARMLRQAAAEARAAGVWLPLVRADALSLPVRAGSLDGVTAHSFLYLLPDPAAALAEARHALRPGGRIAVLEPRAAPGSLGAALRGGARTATSMVLWRAMSGLHRRFAEAELENLLAAAGFAGARAWPVLGGYGVMATAERP